MQPAVENEIEKPKGHRHIEKAKNIDENCFVSPAVLTIKKDKSVSVAHHYKRMNDELNRRGPKLYFVRLSGEP